MEICPQDKAAKRKGTFTGKLSGKTSRERGYPSRFLMSRNYPGEGEGETRAGQAEVVVEAKVLKQERAPRVQGSLRKPCSWT